MKPIDAILNRFSREAWLSEEFQKIEAWQQKKIDEGEVRRRTRVSLSGEVTSALEPAGTGLVRFTLKPDSGKAVRVILQEVLIYGQCLNDFCMGVKVKCYGYKDGKGCLWCSAATILSR